MGGVTAFLLLLLLAMPAAAQPDPAAARRAAEAERAAAGREAEAARNAESRAEALLAERVAGAARVQALEREVVAATLRVLAAEDAEAGARDAAGRIAAELAPLLPPLLRLAAEPAPLLLAAPLPPADVALGLVALRGMLGEAAALSARLREEQGRAAREAAEGERERARLEAARREAAEAGAALDRQVEAARREAARRTDAEREALLRAETQVARARSLEEAMARLEAARAAEERARERVEAAPRRATTPRPPEPRPAPEPPAQPGAMPVAGTLVRGWGSPGEGGPARGVSIATPAGARVTAPCAGPVAFAGPFRSYGRLVILDCGGGQHWVLAGLERLDVAMGGRVGAGEPVGVMAREGRPVLYLELRRRGEAADPRPWLRGAS